MKSYLYQADRQALNISYSHRTEAHISKNSLHKKLFYLTTFNTLWPLEYFVGDYAVLINLKCFKSYTAIQHYNVFLKNLHTCMSQTY